MWGRRFVRRFGRGSPGLYSLYLGLVGALTLTAGAVPAAAKPDFTVRSVKFPAVTGGPPHVFDNRASPTLTFLIKVKNVGDRVAGGHGVLKVLGDGQLQTTNFDFDVPRLGPGDASVIRGPVAGTDLPEINDYGSKACARARRDANAGNDCHKGPRFADIPKTWVGSTNSTVDDLGEVQTCGSGVTFSYDNTRSGAEYVYSGSGSLSCTASGGSGGCTYEGHGDTTIEKQLTSLSIAARLTGYSGAGASSKSYVGTETCPPNPPKAYTFYYSSWFFTGFSTRGMLATDTTLSGTYPAPSGDTYSWNLTAN